MTGVSIEIERDCVSCKWLRQKGSHYSCYYKYDWKMWLPQGEPELSPLCETGKYSSLAGCKWEKR